MYLYLSYFKDKILVELELMSFMSKVFSQTKLKISSNEVYKEIICLWFNRLFL